METIFQAIQEGIILLDGRGHIEYANRAAEKLLGFALKDAEGEPLKKYIRGMEWGLLDEMDIEAWSQLVQREIEVTYPEHRFLQFYVAPLSAMEDSQRGAVMILRDVTRERETQADTLESERLNAIMLLAAGVAHEIGNPLNSLNIHLQLLNRELDDIPEPKRAELAELLDIARGEITRLDQILTQFLGAIRTTQPKLEPADVKELVEQTIRVMGSEIKDRAILVEVEAPESLPELHVDKGQIKQAFYNLIKNAIQAMDEAGVLTILLGADDQHISVAFRDTGGGISKEDIVHIFDAYHTTKKEGTGLGLMIVQRILRDHGGLVEINTVPGEGTTVTLLIPREDRRVRLLESTRKQSAEIHAS